MKERKEKERGLPGLVWWLLLLFPPSTLDCPIVQNQGYVGGFAVDVLLRALSLGLSGSEMQAQHPEECVCPQELPFPHLNAHMCFF